MGRACRRDEDDLRDRLAERETEVERLDKELTRMRQGVPFRPKPPLGDSRPRTCTGLPIGFVGFCPKLPPQPRDARGRWIPRPPESWPKRGKRTYRK